MIVDISVAAGIGTQVSILDSNRQRLAYIDEVIHGSNVITLDMKGGDGES